MRENLLIVDDEAHIRSSVERALRMCGWQLFTAATGEEALAVMAQREMAVLIADNLMPGMRGVELLRLAKERYPDTVRILMTGYADLETALVAINGGEIFRFIVKPWGEEELVGTLVQSINRHATLRLLRREDDAVIRSLARTIELKDPCTRGHCERVAGYAQLISWHLGLTAEAQKDIRYGSWLHDCGKIGVPEQILNHRGPMSTGDFAVIRKHPEWGAEVARQAQFSPVVVNAVMHHHEHYDGSGYPAGLAGSRIPLEARIVAVADTYDALTTDRPYRKACDPREARRFMTEEAVGLLDPGLVAVLFEALDEEGAECAGAGR